MCVLRHHLSYFLWKLLLFWSGWFSVQMSFVLSKVIGSSWMVTEVHDYWDNLPLRMCVARSLRSACGLILSDWALLGAILLTFQQVDIRLWQSLTYQTAGINFSFWMKCKTESVVFPWCESYWNIAGLEKTCLFVLSVKILDSLWPYLCSLLAFFASLIPFN